MLPLAEGARNSEITSVNCFSRAYDTLNFATNGRISSHSNANANFDELLLALDSAASPSATELASGVSPFASFVNGIHYDGTSYSVASVSYTSAFACTLSQTFGHSNMGAYSWDNRAESSKAYSGCNLFWHYENTSWTGAILYCGITCSTFGALNNQVSSWHLRH